MEKSFDLTQVKNKKYKVFLQRDRKGSKWTVLEQQAKQKYAHISVLLAVLELKSVEL